MTIFLSILTIIVFIVLFFFILSVLPNIRFFALLGLVSVSISTILGLLYLLTSSQIYDIKLEYPSIASSYNNTIISLQTDLQNVEIDITNGVSIVEQLVTGVNSNRPAYEKLRYTDDCDNNEYKLNYINYSDFPNNLRSEFISNEITVKFDDTPIMDGYVTITCSPFVKTNQNSVIIDLYKKNNIDISEKSFAVLVKNHTLDSR